MVTKRLVAVIGAGPAGLFMASSLVKAGCAVVLINRDIKPGGLVEYGVFPTKHKFKNGLRKQFRKTLSNNDVAYRGHVSVGVSATVPASARWGWQRPYARPRRPGGVPVAARSSGGSGDMSVCVRLQGTTATCPCPQPNFSD